MIVVVVVVVLVPLDVLQFIFIQRTPTPFPFPLLHMLTASRTEGGVMSWRRGRIKKGHSALKVLVQNLAARGLTLAKIKLISLLCIVHRKNITNNKTLFI
jgi:hypothetical protein